LDRKTGAKKAIYEKERAKKIRKLQKKIERIEKQAADGIESGMISSTTNKAYFSQKAPFPEDEVTRLMDILYKNRY
uniref:Resolvase n=1 Tax=Rhabditophanes sp. KR3021 TaxID=114890 RepID=A0AC35U2S2_9BILA